MCVCVCVTNCSFSADLVSIIYTIIKQLLFVLNAACCEVGVYVNSSVATCIEAAALTQKYIFLFFVVIASYNSSD